MPKGQGAAAAKQVNQMSSQLLLESQRFYLISSLGIQVAIYNVSATSWFQMGLFVDLSPEEMLMGMDANLDDPALEAELAAITGGSKAPADGRAKQKRKG